MVMFREIISDPLEPEDLWQDLNDNLKALEEFGVESVNIFFGVAWGNEMYEGNWKEFPVPTREVATKILMAEEKEYGSLGSDNVYISIPEFEAKVHYTYECDITLSYGEENPLISRILNRWEENGWLLVHRSRKRQKLPNRK